MLDRLTLLFRFRAIAGAGSLRRAAEELGVTQPALSRALAQLEAHYGQQLLERHARGVRVTGFGLQLLGAIGRLSRELELAEQELLGSGHTMTGNMRILAGPLWTAVVLPQLIGPLQARFPELEIEILHADFSSSVQKLNEAVADVSFAGLTGLEQQPDSPLVHRVFTSVRDRVIARAGHPILKRGRPDGTIDPMAVHDYPWLIYTANPIYEQETVHTVLERTGVAPRIRVRSASLLSVLGLLQNSDLLSILPDAAVTGVDSQLVPLAIDIGRRETVSGALYRRAMANWPPLAALLELSEAHFAAAAPRRRGRASNRGASRSVALS